MQTSNYLALLATYQQSAATALTRGQWMKAARVLRDALRECEEVGELHEGLTATANQLAEKLIDQHKYSEAEILYRAVLEVREKLFGTNHPQVTESLQKLAVLQITTFRAEAMGKNFPGVAAAS